MIAFIDDHREVHGVEPISRVLPIAPSTYREPVAKRRDEKLKAEVRRVFEENVRVYGARKVWRQLQREGVRVARCTVSRLMRKLDLQGALRDKPPRPTVSDKASPGPLRPGQSRVPVTGAEPALGLGLQCAMTARRMR